MHATKRASDLAVGDRYYFDGNFGCESDFAVVESLTDFGASIRFERSGRVSIVPVALLSTPRWHRVAPKHTTPSAFTCPCPECLATRAELADVIARTKVAREWAAREGRGS